MKTSDEVIEFSRGEESANKAETVYPKQIVVESVSRTWVPTMACSPCRVGIAFVGATSLFGDKKVTPVLSAGTRLTGHSRMIKHLELMILVHGAKFEAKGEV